MESEDIVGMVMGIFFFVTTGAVLLLRPLMKKLGAYLEVLAEERRNKSRPAPIERSDAARLAAALESIETRRAKIEEQQEFTERLLAARERPQIR